ncbi:hypothetical protein DSBG_3581 [Desulfosporosinus sp. BG]|nr:hypothetical protein DSBG_3581 [Desulfosporosinus sp. BG]
MIRIGLAEIGSYYDSTADKLFNLKKENRILWRIKLLCLYKDPSKGFYSWISRKE